MCNQLEREILILLYFLRELPKTIFHEVKSIFLLQFYVVNTYTDHSILF